MSERDPEVLRYEKMFYELGFALLKLEATPAEAILSLSLFLDTIMTVRVNNPEWFSKASLQEVLGINWGNVNEDNKNKQDFLRL